MIETARGATADDLSRLTDLVEASHGEMQPQRGGQIYLTEALPADAARLLRQLGDQRCAVLAGTIDDVIVGVATAELVTLDGYGTVARIRDLFVEPEARQVGVGAALIDALTTWARDHDAIGLDSTVLPGNRASKNFFEAHGLVARAILVHRRFAEPSTEDDA